ncbi:Coatomer subunit alpha [Armadillidium nasatum]|uniref:Coatomer subunit alpha n=1 Tax=Armadillidium nasatum TaxID=96803 RepID=A0A5N5TPB6_9CRUS|nr:Coatomer subunit alpha [Armadillidium nasatum]
MEIIQLLNTAYQQTKNYDKLSFLYLITGNLAKLRRMMKINEIRKDFEGWYTNALYLGDVQERIRVLKACSKTSLALLTASTHGFVQEVENLSSHVEEGNLPEVLPTAQLLQPPPPIQQMENAWPQLTVAKGFFDTTTAAAGKSNVMVVEDVSAMDVAGDGWGSDEEEKVEVEDGDEEAGWDVDDEIELPPELEGALPSGASISGEEGYYVPPPRGHPPSQMWASKSQLAIDHILAGSFESAARLLHDQVGVVNFEPYKELFLSSYSHSRTSFPGLPNLPSLFAYPARNYKTAQLKDQLPVVGEASQLTTAAKFSEALEKFSSILLAIPLLCVDTKQEITEAQNLVRICKEYTVGISMEIYRKSLGKTSESDLRRSLELAAYFTHCELQTGHQVLTLRTAVNVAFKMKNYKLAMSFGRRLLNLAPRPEVAQHVRKVILACEKNPVDEVTITYDEHNPFSICAKSYVPIYRGKPEVTCPLCGASYVPEFKGITCAICRVSQVGKDSVGLRISSMMFR